MVLTEHTDGNGKKQKFWAFPRSLPMGWIAAPFLAQSCSWGIVLTQPEGESWDGADLDIDYLDAMKEQKSPLPWLPLKSGGGIFVFLDNILVVTDKKEVAEWWENKIIRDCRDLHAWLKSEDPKYDPTAPVADQKEMLKDCFVTLSRDDLRNSQSKQEALPSFDFLGVRWTFNGRSVILKNDEDKKSMPGVDEYGVWKGKRREMAAILGRILWYRRVHGITYFDKSSCVETRAILTMYRNLSPPVTDDHELNKKAWDDYIIRDDVETIAGLSKAWEQRAKETVSYAVPYRPAVRPSEIIFAVTDACTCDDIHKMPLAGGFWYRPGEKLRHIPTATNVEMNKVLDTFTGEIALGEMKAIILTVKEALQKANAKLIVLATDNMSCKYWIEKGHAKKEEMQAMLDELHTMLNEKNCRLYVTYVHTDDNIADELSRNRQVVMNKAKGNHELLVRALKEATTSLWNIGGGTVGGATNEIKSKEKK